MISPKELAATPQSKATFYPTPMSLAEKMLDGINMDMVKSVLEPSAGKGDLAKFISEKLYTTGRGYRRIYDDHDRRAAIEESDVDCIELDQNLRAILKDKGFRVVHDDFLTFRTYKRYDLILMNPPFDRGEEHLHKALSLLERNGGTVVCILNADTIRNPYTTRRQLLNETIRQYEGTVTECGRAFAAADAERRTDAEVVIVRVTIPAPEKHSNILDDMREAVDTARADEPDTQYTAMTKGNYIDALIDRCEYEIACGVRLIDEMRDFTSMVCSSYQEEAKRSIAYSTMCLSFGLGKHEDVTSNAYIRKVRRKYWSILFQQPQFLEQLTSNLRNELQSMVDKLADYDFSAYNIYTIAQRMLLQINGGIEETIMRQFDNWTRLDWHENSPNRHYYNGWKTNSAFAVEKKVIFPFYGAFHRYSFCPDELNEYECIHTVTDIEKVFDFLDGGRTQGINCETAIRAANKQGVTRNIQCKHFKVTFFKKGTCHVTFTNLDVLHKFNLFAAIHKNWLPPTYGKKSYTDMDAEEQAVIDSFEGQESYEKVMQHSDYYLNTTLPPLLGTGA